MPRRSSNSPGSSRSSSSSRSAGGSHRDHELSLNLYSHQNGHWGTTMYKKGDSDGQLYHVRSDERQDADKFFNNYREKQKIASQALYGRSVYGKFSEGESRRAHQVLYEYGQQDENIPRYSKGTNCQTFSTGMMGGLEREGLIRKGTQAYYSTYHGVPGKDIAKSLQSDGRSWIPVERKPQKEPADARFNETARRPATGRLQLAAFEDTLVRRAPQTELRVPRSSHRSSSRSTDRSSSGRSSGSSRYH